MSNFKKLAAERAKRTEELYSIDEDYSAYTPICPDHPGVRRELLDEKQKKSKGLSLTQMAWKCPVDDKVYEAEGGIDQQTHGMSLMNNIPKAQDSIADENGEFKEVETIKSDSERKIRE